MFGFTIADLDIRHLGSLEFCFLLYFKISVEDFHCEVCELAKHKRVSFPVCNKTSFIPFHLEHSDIWGLSRVNTLFNKRWLISFIDDHTRLCWVYLLNGKSEVEHTFEQFFFMIKISMIILLNSCILIMGQNI